MISINYYKDNDLNYFEKYFILNIYNQFKHENNIKKKLYAWQSFILLHKFCNR